MDHFLRFRLYVLLAFGRRAEALELIRKRFRVNEEESSRLLLVLETESPLPVLNAAKLLKWTGTGIFLAGVILTGIGIIRYFAYAPNDERPLAVIQCTVEGIRDLADGLEIIFAYDFQGKPYSITERSDVFRELGLQKGMVLELWVNPSNPEQGLLPVLKPMVQASGLRYGGMGLALIVVSIILWRWSVASRKSSV